MLYICGWNALHPSGWIHCKGESCYIHNISGRYELGIGMKHRAATMCSTYSTASELSPELLWVHPLTVQLNPFQRS